MTEDRLWNANYLKACSANFMLYFSFMVVTPLLPLYLSEVFGATKDETGMVLSGYALTALLVRPFSGFLVDSFPRKVILLVCYGLFAILFGGYLVAGSLLAFCILRTLHGAPMGATTVANSTVAIDVLPSSRRAEGIGYYGVSNNLGTAIAPTVGMLIYQCTANYDIIFLVSLLTAGMGFAINSTLHLKPRPQASPLSGVKLSFDRFLLLKSWPEALCMVCYSFSYGVVSTYIAIYAKQELGITTGTGLFFTLLCVGLVSSRLVGARGLRQGRIAENAAHGVLISVIGYLVFAAQHNMWGFYGAAFIVGLGNGHMFPAFQTMFINMAPASQRGTANSTLLTAWDTGFGLGIILGGIAAEHFSYGAAFWLSWAVNAAGTILFFAYARSHFLSHRLS
ncbi:MAG: MFS transporter [Prevotellaceae bacterium]|nr:MFS transporter [Prevotellaceae bacterium]